MSLLSWTVSVSNRLCHAEPQDSENVKKKIFLISSFFSIVLMPTLCYLCKYTFYVTLALEVGKPLH